MTDEEFRAWLAAPLSLADLLRIELDELRRQDEIAAAAEQAAIDARLGQLVRASINSTVRWMLTRPPVYVDRPMVDSPGWPTVRQPGGNRPRGLPSTAAMIRAVS